MNTGLLIKNNGIFALGLLFAGMLLFSGNSFNIRAQENIGNIEKSAVEEKNEPIIIPSSVSDFDFSSQHEDCASIGTCLDFCKEAEKQRVLEEEAANAKKLMAQKSPALRVPGVKFTNDKNKTSCDDKNSDHKKSEAGKGKHYDEDCCIDRDEWLQPGCTYLYSDYNYSLDRKLPPPPYKNKK